MQNNIIPFDFGDNLVRVIMRDTQPWFLAKDVCDVLEHSNHRMAIQGLDEDEKGVSNAYTLGGEQNITVVSESGLYSLIFRSRKPEAKKFRKWVTSEVLPTLRKTGTYECKPLFAEPNLNLPDAALFLKPALRTTAMNAAMQMVKHAGGNLDDFDALYVKYCSMLAAKPSVAHELEGLPPVRYCPNSDGLILDEHMFQQWAVKRLAPALQKGERATKLYHDFKLFCKKNKVAPPSIKKWGELMTERFDKFKSGCIKYRVGLTEPFGRQTRRTRN
ncbi:Bro-N domain-containing protein [Maridesulfovibrio ferrireducens]|uniref:BRO-N domain-containing protein n=1 Tax=Maridesulfovibrio ferrireducens TaxID=246191 RepID=UPI001A23F132|nr:Bro-N domain-containing protein [Maridesulfovibrio ferrireducens]MBI9112262.1 Bro-N domain-containing protein [Maridesulfovibrio ferrireducens]